MKNKIIFIALIAIVTWYVKRETIIDKLMDVQFPITISEGSGIQDYEPESGSLVDIADQVEKGLVTIAYFYNSSCDACRIFNTNLNKLTDFRPDIAVVKFPVGNIAYKVRYHGKHLNVEGIPFIMIFDRAGKLVVTDDGDKHKGYETFYGWLQAEVDRKNAQLKEEWERKHNT